MYFLGHENVIMASCNRGESTPGRDFFLLRLVGQWHQMAAAMNIKKENAMRFDVVFLVVIFILVGFGFMFSDWLQLRDQLAEAEKEIRALQSELSASQSENQGLSQNLDACKLENGTLQAQNEALVQNGHALWEENQRLTQANSQLQAEVNRLDASMQDAQSANGTACLAPTNLSSLAQAGESGTDLGKIILFVLSGLLTIGAGSWEVIHRARSRRTQSGYIRLTDEERQLVIRHRRQQR